MEGYLRKRMDITGNQYGYLEALEFSHVSNSHSMWKFRCICGKEIIRSASDVKAGKLKSCGCQQHNRDIKSHGESHTKLYQCWKGMKGRCSSNKRYIKKGIKVFSEWENYDNFKNWALLNGYNDTLTLDRIDGKGNYEPSNCRWATATMQQNNVDTNFFITYNDVTKTLSEWCRQFHLNYSTTWRRLKSNYSIEEAFKVKGHK
jgi:hypothetical protein